MAPYGPANMRPVFLTRGLVDTGYARLVGDDHIKMSLCHPDDPKRSFDAIAFKQGRHLELVKSGRPFSVLYTVEENEWNGRRTVQLNIKDIKPGVDDLLVQELPAGDLLQEAR
jgi:single-stranded-DNA-specific exonuclease